MDTPPFLFFRKIPFVFRYQVIGANNVAVPTHFFKVLVREDEPGGELHLESYVLPNQPIPDDAPLQAFMVSEWACTSGRDRGWGRDEASANMAEWAGG